MRLGSFLTLLLFCFVTFYSGLVWLFDQQNEPLMFVDTDTVKDWANRYPSIRSLQQESMRDNVLSFEEIEQMRKEYLNLQVRASSGPGVALSN